MFIDQPNQTYTVCEGQAVSIGLPNLCTAMEDLVYTWYSVDASGNATPVPGVLPNDTQIDVTPTATSIYRLCRTFTENDPDYNLVGNIGCADKCVDFTFNITPQELCCAANVAFYSFAGQPDYTASSTGSLQTWNNTTNPFGNVNTNTTNVFVNGVIAIPSGANVLMQNLRISFGPRGMIVVKPGGSLIIDNCTLTGLQPCKTMWQGIRVYKQSANQGILSVTNNTLIANALVGVSTQKLAYQALETIAANITTIPDFANTNLSTIALADIWSDPIVQTTGGGLLTLENTTFSDCFQSINLSWRNASNLDLFVNNCNFLTQNPDLYYPFNMLNRTECAVCGTNIKHKVVLNNSDFTNLKYGVRLNNTRYLGANPLDDASINYFTDCKVGISMRNLFVSPGNFTDFDAYTNQFTNCKVGIQCQAAEAELRYNNFNNTTANFTDNDDIGLFMLGSKYNITQNGTENVSRGVVITDSDANPANVSHNDILDARFGIAAIGDNQNTTIGCNNLLNYRNTALALLPWAANNQTGMLPNQGDCFNNKPAANLFVPPAGGGATLPDIFRWLPNTTNFRYREYDDQLPPAISGFEITPGIFQSCGPSIPGYNRETYCASNVPQMSLADIKNLTNETEKEAALAQLINYYISTRNAADLNTLLNEVQTRLTYRLKIALSLANDDISTVETWLNQLALDKDEDIYFDYLHRLLLQKKQNNQDIYTLSPTEEAMLLNIANSRTATAHKAQAWLYAAKGYEFEITDGDIKLEDWTGISTSFKTNTTPNTLAVLYPNPATNQAQLYHQLPENETATFNLYNTMGTLVNTTTLNGNGVYKLNTANYQPGLYYYTLSSHNNLLQRGTLVITR